MYWKIALVIGVAAEAVGMGLPGYWPTAPEWVWGIFVWGGLAVIAGAIVLGVWPRLTSMSVLFGQRRNSRVPMIEIRDAVAQRGWDFNTDTSLHILDLCEALRQGGLDREISFWGRPDRNIFDSLTKSEPLNPISNNHWKDFEIDPINLHKTDDNFNVRTQNKVGPSEKGYVDVHTEKKAAMRWLKQNETDFKGKRK